LPERRGTIEISLKRHHLGKTEGLRPSGDYALIGVSDNGQGLDKSSKEKIFEPFHTRRSNGKKIGLELFLVRETIHAHHGEIVVESEPGHGLAFHVYLPAVKEK
jgi:signal transduction histidine kinase